MKRFIRLPEVLNRVPVSRSTIYHLASMNEFPKPVSLGGNSVAWIEREVDEWMELRAAKRDRP